MRFHNNMLRKSETEKGIFDEGILEEKYPHAWECFIDKGYEGAAEFIRIISPEKKPVARMFSLMRKNSMGKFIPTV